MSKISLFTILVLTTTAAGCKIDSLPPRANQDAAIGTESGTSGGAGANGAGGTIGAGGTPRTAGVSSSGGTPAATALAGSAGGSTAGTGSSSTGGLSSTAGSPYFASGSCANPMADGGCLSSHTLVPTTSPTPVFLTYSYVTNAGTDGTIGITSIATTTTSQGIDSTHSYEGAKSSFIVKAGLKYIVNDQAVVLNLQKPYVDTSIKCTHTLSLPGVILTANFVGYECDAAPSVTLQEDVSTPRGTGGTTGTGGMTTSPATGGIGGPMGAGGTTTAPKDAGTPPVTGTGGTGGSTGAGGATTPPNQGTVVSIANFQAQGAMTGFGWAAGGDLDTITDPTCDSPKGPMTSGVFCSWVLWSSATAYCAAGSIPALPASPSSTDYTQNWGIQLGINATPDSGGALGQSFTGVSISLTGAPLSGLRVIVHRKGDDVNTNYCSSLISPGETILFSSFSTTCWDTTSTGTPLAVADVASLDQIGVQVPSGNAAISVKSLCITGITFIR